MTVWAFVSDIHGNRAALERAEALCRANGAEQFVCLGDVIGRGDPDGCVSWVHDRAALAVQGNRDLDHLARVSPELRPVVLGWPNEVTAADFVASHGDPRLHPVLRSVAERDGFARATSYMRERGARLWLFGHTHRARMWRVTKERVALLARAEVVLAREAHYVVNVGTTGLPLPGRGGPSVVIYDDAQGVVRALAVPAAPSERR